MKIKETAISLCLIAVLLVYAVSIGLGGPPRGGKTGPDMTVHDIIGAVTWGQDNGIVAYSVGIETCNVGDEVVPWDAGSSNHPVMGRSLFRLEDGRFEMIGMGWLRHGICALGTSGCGTCQPTACESLGIGCTTQNSAATNGAQVLLGPRSDVNAKTGEFPYPPTSPPYGSVIDRRLQAKIVDVDPAAHPNAVWFVEAVNIDTGDAAAGTAGNNASCRTAVFTPAPTYGMQLTSSTSVGVAAIEAWQSADPQVELLEVTDPDDGRFLVGSRVTENGDGTWHYEYAIYNRDSHRSGRGLTVPLASGVILSDVDFHDVDYHSGEPYDGADWSTIQTPSSIAWSTTPWETDANANALRFSTLYNFRFDANAPPIEDFATLDLFRPGAPDSVAFPLDVPGPAEALRIVLTPHATKVPAGTDLVFDVTVENSTQASRTFDGWIDVKKPNGSDWSGNPAVGPKQATLNPGRSVTKTVRLRIPSRIPPSGPYRMIGKLGAFPATVETSSSFEFHVTAP